MWSSWKLIWSHVITIITFLIDDKNLQGLKKGKIHFILNNTFITWHCILFLSYGYFHIYLRIHMSFSPNEGKKTKEKRRMFQFPGSFFSFLLMKCKRHITVINYLLFFKINKLRFLKLIWVYDSFVIISG